MNKSYLRLFSIVLTGTLGVPAFAGPSTLPSAALPTTTPSVAMSPSTAPSKVAVRGATTQPDMAAIQEFLKQARPELDKLEAIDKDHSIWSDPAKRAALSPDAQAPLRNLLGMMNDMVQKGHSTEIELVGGDGLVTMAAVFGDADLQKQIADMSTRTDAEGRWARNAQTAAKYWLANGDTAAQAKALDGLEAFATADSANKMSVVHDDLDIFESNPGKDIADRVDTFVTVTLKSPAITRMKEEKAAAASRDLLVGKPMVLSGVLRDGTNFSTADLKGKVILVDFWASWCGPCKAELPRVKKEYADLHQQGLEVIGVSCDYQAAALTNFLNANPDMPWPQLFDSAHPGWNQIAKDNFILGIPTMFLIDKNGVCRSVKAREDFEKMIPQLLAEKPAAI